MKLKQEQNQIIIFNKFQQENPILTVNDLAIIADEIGVNYSVLIYKINLWRKQKKPIKDFLKNNFIECNI